MWCRASLLCLSLAAMLAGCGGKDDDTAVIKKAVDTLATQEFSDGTFDVSGPTYLDFGVSPPRVDGLRVSKQGENTATVTGRVRGVISAKPKLDKAEFLRAVSAAGGTVNVAREFTVQAIKQGDQWVMGEDGFQLEEAPAAQLTQEELEQARQLAVEAMTALLKFDGNLAAYARAQSGFYATKPASEADFNQPDFDPAPSLELKTKELGSSSWPRTNDGGEDDLYLGDLFSFPGESEGSAQDCGKMIVRTMKASTVSGELTGSATVGSIEEKVLVSGQAVVRVGDWLCERLTGLGTRSAPRREGPREVTIKYLAAVTRLAFGSQDWFITAVQLSDRDVGGVAFGKNSLANLYNTGAGDVEILASP